MPEGPPSTSALEEEGRFIGASDISRYEIMNIVGEGTFGVVYKGRRKAPASSSRDTGLKKNKALEDGEDELVARGLRVRIGDVVALKELILHNKDDGVS